MRTSRPHSRRKVRIFQGAFAPVGKFVHRDAGGQLGGDGGDREAGGLGSQGGGTGCTGVALKFRVFHGSM